jgi:predicted deacylase
VAKKKRSTPRFLIVVWGLNILGGLGLAAFLLIRNGTSATHTRPMLASVNQNGDSISAATLSSAPTQVLPPTPYHLPTVTSNPRGTQIAGQTPTPPSITIEAPHGRAQVIGYSVAGRPLEVFRFGNGARERLIVAGIHGGYEGNTIELADELIAHFEEHPELIPSDLTLYILRSLNPDGYERARGYEGRVNDRSVDLNHNFPYHWKLEWDRDGCWNYLPTTGGTHPASEPETIALMNFIELHDFEALISYHSAALGIFAGGLPPFAPSEDLARTLSYVSPYQYPPYDTGCEYSGNLTDWASNVKGIPAVDIELRNHRDTDFEINLKVLDAFLKWER